MADDKLQFSFELIDNVSDSASQMADSASDADDAVNRLTESEERAISTTRTLDNDLKGNQVQLLTQMAVIGSLSGAVNSITGGMRGLGIVSDETAEKLQGVGSAFAIIKGTAQGLTAVKALMATLNAQTAINASLSSYLAVLKNPAMLAGVALAGGAAIGVAGAYLMNSSNNTTNNNTTNVTIEDTSPKNATEVYRIFGGGAL